MNSVTKLLQRWAASDRPMIGHTSATGSPTFHNEFEGSSMLRASVHRKNTTLAESRSGCILNRESKMEFSVSDLNLFGLFFGGSCKPADSESRPAFVDSV